MKNIIMGRESQLKNNKTTSALSSKMSRITAIVFGIGVGIASLGGVASAQAATSDTYSKATPYCDVLLADSKNAQATTCYSTKAQRADAKPQMARLVSVQYINKNYLGESANLWAQNGVGCEDRTKVYKWDFSWTAGLYNAVSSVDNFASCHSKQFDGVYTGANIIVGSASADLGVMNDRTNSVRISWNGR